MKKKLFFCLAIIAGGFYSLPAYAQREVSEKDKEIINRRAVEILNADGVGLRPLLDYLAAKDNDPGDKDGMIKAKFDGVTKIFISSQAPINSDINPDLEDSTDIDAVDYLDNFSHYYTATDNNLIQFKNFVSDKLRFTDSDQIYFNVYYDEVFPGKPEGLKDVVNKTYPARKRYAQFSVLKTEHGWDCIISKIGYYRYRKIDDDTTHLVKIIYGKPSSIETVDEAYYAKANKLGVKYKNAGIFDEAYIEFTKCAFEGPYKAEAQSALEDIKKAFFSKGSTSIDATLKEAFEKNAYDMRQKKRYPEALRYFEALKSVERNAVKSRPYFAGSQAMKAKIDELNAINKLYETRDYTEAITRYTNAINTEGEDANMYLGRARCYAALDNFSAAEADFNRAIALDKTNRDFYYWEGKYYVNANKVDHAKPVDFEKAYGDYARYISLMGFDDSKLNEVMSDMAYCKGQLIYRTNAGTDAAVDSFTASIKYNSNNVKAYYWLARCYYDVDQKDSALNILTRASQVQEKESGVHYLTGKILVTEKKKGYARGVSELKKAADIDGKNGLYNLDYASQLNRSANGKKSKRKINYKEAIRYFTNCIESDSVLAPSAYFNRGRCYANLGNYANAISDFEQIQIRYGSDSLFHKEFGKVLIKAGRYAEAKDHFDKAPRYDAETLLGLGEAIYLSEPNATDKSKYLNYFDQAFAKGIAYNIIDNDPVVQQLEKDKEFKKLKVSHKYW